ncbi:DNA recombinase [Leucobacter sp. UCD-THU]|uniref:DNA recombination protein RmuC n=1 Tax=Leucobacter muris TaxID=1935379 RepID=A0ABX5QDD5_9MICO|nr:MULTISPECIES: DNA recombination protein RmuC [Leucobacter]EYT56545.1 DNA recombinase [Leucobacter sp. UCD-THU]QAB17072.1 DNA recombination protein RmuC [Leucobacter muris]
MTTLTLLLIVVAALVFGVAGFIAGHRVAASGAARRIAEAEMRAERERTLAVQQARLDAEAGARLLREELAAAETRVQGLEDRLRDAHLNAQQRSEIDREEQRVLQQLAPLRDSLGKLERTVATIEQQRASQHGELAEQLREAARAEEKLRGTAESLAAALRSNNTRGLWGETQLRRLIEAAGMVEHVDFEVQQHLPSENGAARPDVVVRLPGGKSIAIDAKVPFDAYLEAQHVDDESRRSALLNRHAKALRDHIVALSNRGYWTALADSPELVVAFVPSESLLSSALDTDPLLLEYAFERRVALASPVSLWAILKSVAHSWRQESLTTEARTLFDLSRQLHTRLGRTASHLDKLGRTLSRGVQDYNAYIGSLERQVLPTARKIGALNGEKIGTEPAQLEDAVRPLIAPELRPAGDSDADGEGAAPGAPATAERVSAEGRPATDGELARDETPAADGGPAANSAFWAEREPRQPAADDEGPGENA